MPSTTGGSPGLSHYSYADLGAVGDMGTHPTGINDAGIVTGYFDSQGGTSFQAFRHTGTTPVIAAEALPIPTNNDNGIAVGGYSNINASGTIVGSDYGAYSNIPPTASIQQAFVYDTSFHNLGALPLAISGRSRAYAAAVNDSGTIAGYDEFDDQGVTHAFRHTGTGPLTAADDLGTFTGYANVRTVAINQAGLIAGTASTAGSAASYSVPHTFIYDTTFHDLGTLPNCTTSVATGISNSGSVVGYGSSSASNHSFRHSGTSPLTAADDLGQLPGGAGLVVLAVNSAGDVVGNGDTQGGTQTAFISKAGGSPRSLTDSTLVTNLPSGFGLQNATAINSSGQIVGYTNTSGISHAWLLTPTP